MNDVAFNIIKLSAAIACIGFLTLMQSGNRSIKDQFLNFRDLRRSIVNLNTKYFKNFWWKFVGWLIVLMNALLYGAFYIGILGVLVGLILITFS